MTDATAPQLYLLSPAQFELDRFADDLAKVLDAREVACLRLTLSQDDPAQAHRAADRLRAVAHSRDVAVVVTDHVGLVEPHGLDGVHLSDGHTRLRDVRKTLGPDRIVGSFCGASRHIAMTAGEIGADYVCFGPVNDDGLTGAEVAPTDLFAWWGQMIEVPQVAEGNLTPQAIATLSPYVEFFALGGAIWTDPDGPLAGLEKLFPA